MTEEIGSDSLAQQMEAWAKAGADLLEGPSPAVEAARRTARIYLHAGTTEERERANLIADEILKAAGTKLPETGTKFRVSQAVANLRRAQVNGDFDEGFEQALDAMLEQFDIRTGTGVRSVVPHEVENAKARLERSLWDSRAMPEMRDIRVLLDALANLQNGEST